MADKTSQDSSASTPKNVVQMQANTAAKVTASTTKTATSTVKETDAKQKTGGSSLADFLLHLEDYTPTVFILRHIK